MKLKTSRGDAVFGWRAVEIKSIHVDGNRARVEIIQNERHNLGGSGGTLNLTRENGQWQIHGLVQIWQS